MQKACVIERAFTETELPPGADGCRTRKGVPLVCIGEIVTCASDAILASDYGHALAGIHAIFNTKTMCFSPLISSEVLFLPETLRSRP